MFSALPLKADMTLRTRYVRCRPHARTAHGSAVQAGAMLRPVACQRLYTSDRPAAQLDRARMSLSAASVQRGQRRAGLAPRALDLKSWVAAVDGLVDRRARIDGAATGWRQAGIWDQTMEAAVTAILQQRAAANF
jgi:hypothetical protein